MTQPSAMILSDTDYIDILLAECNGPIGRVSNISKSFASTIAFSRNTSLKNLTAKVPISKGFLRALVLL